MAKLAIIVSDGSGGARERRLGRVFDFFGVPWKMAGPSELSDLSQSCSDYVVLGSIRAVAALLKANHGTAATLLQATAYYAYPDDERTLCVAALQSLLDDANVSLQDAPSREASIHVSDEFRDLAGPMAGLKFSLQMKRDDAVLTGATISRESKCAIVISAGADPVFVRVQNDRAPVYFCTSSRMIDIDVSQLPRDSTMSRITSAVRCRSSCSSNSCFRRLPGSRKNLELALSLMIPC